MSGKKRWVMGLVVLALVIAAAFPVRAAVREYRFQKALADLSAGSGTNTEHISMCLESMCELIDTALAEEDVYARRTALNAVSAWAEDCSDSLGEIDFYFDAYIQSKDRSYVGRYFTGDYEIRDGCLKLSSWLIPYITGETEPDEMFRETLLAAKEDLLWLDGLWDDSFRGEQPEAEVIAAYHTLFYSHEAEFARFFIEVHQAVGLQNQ